MATSTLTPTPMPAPSLARPPPLQQMAAGRSESTGRGTGCQGGPSTLTQTPISTPIPTTAAGNAAGAAQRMTARFNLQKPDSWTAGPPPTTVPAAPPSKKSRAAPSLKRAAHSFRESAGLMRGYVISFRVVFQETNQRSARTAATTVIQRALCGWGRKQRLGFTLDVRETTDTLEGIVEGVHNGNVTEDTMCALKSKIHELLRTGKRKSDQVWKCAYSCYVYQGDAKPEEMVTSWIVRNGSRLGYERLQTTHPDSCVVELPPPETAAAVPARDTSGGGRPSGSSRSLSDVLAAVEAERDYFQNRVAQISSFKDAMVCVGDVIQIVELLYKFLQERAYLEEGGMGQSRGDSRPLEAAAAMAGRRSPQIISPCLCSLHVFILFINYLAIVCAESD